LEESTIERSAIDAVTLVYLFSFKRGSTLLRAECCGRRWWHKSARVQVCVPLDWIMCLFLGQIRVHSFSSWRLSSRSGDLLNTGEFLFSFSYGSIFSESVLLETLVAQVDDVCVQLC